MPLGRFKVEALNTNTGQSQEVMVKARGIAEAEEKVAALGFAVGKAILVEVLDDEPLPVPAAHPTRVPLPTDPTMCPNCGVNDWKSGKGAGAWTIAFLFFPLGLLAPLLATSRHECANCKYEYRSSTSPVGDVRGDGSVVAGLLYAIVFAVVFGALLAAIASK